MGILFNTIELYVVGIVESDLVSISDNIRYFEFLINLKFLRFNIREKT